MVTTNKNARSRVPHGVIVKAPGLLPMYYTVREITQELGMPERTFRDWLKAGIPHQRDSRGRIWVDGERFAEWVGTQRKPKSKRRLKDGEAYCLSCNRVVKLRNARVVPIKGALIHFRGICEHCGHTINRGGRLGKSR